MQIDQPSLGISREYLIQGIDNKISKAYYEYMIDIAVLLGAEKADARSELSQSLQFEIQLANVSETQHIEICNT